MWDLGAAAVEAKGNVCIALEYCSEGCGMSVNEVRVLLAKPRCSQCLRAPFQVPRHSSWDILTCAQLSSSKQYKRLHAYNRPVPLMSLSH